MGLSFIRSKGSGLTLQLINFLKEQLNFANSEYFIKKKSGRSTWGIVQYFRFIEETDQEIIVPRGFIGKLLRFCDQQRINYEFLDRRSKKDSFDFSTNVNLRSHQKTAVEASARKDFGVITAPAGLGKTVIGLAIIAEKKQPALIVVHRK